MEQDLYAIEDLHIHISGRGAEHDRPCERLKSRVGQSTAHMGIPVSRWTPGSRRHGEHQNRLDAVERVVCERGAVIAGVQRHHLIRRTLTVGARLSRCA